MHECCHASLRNTKNNENNHFSYFLTSVSTYSTEVLSYFRTLYVHSYESTFESTKVLSKVRKYISTKVLYCTVRVQRCSVQAVHKRTTRDTVRVHVALGPYNVQ